MREELDKLIRRSKFDTGQGRPRKKREYSNVNKKDSEDSTVAEAHQDNTRQDVKLEDYLKNEKIVLGKGGYGKVVLT